MTIKFYYGSGSPFSWNVRLVLEHKRLPYEMHLLSLQSGDLKQPGYLAINPRGKVPALMDGDYILWEASVINEYLEECYPDHPVLPSDPRTRATARRIAAEAYSYLYPVLRKLMEQTLMHAEDGGDAATISTALNDLGRELAGLEGRLPGDYFAGQLSLADFTLYPLLALVQRLHDKQPRHNAGAMLGPRLCAFMRRMERLTYFDKTYPPHWKG